MLTQLIQLSAAKTVTVKVMCPEAELGTLMYMVHGHCPSPPYGWKLSAWCADHPLAWHATLPGHRPSPAVMPQH